jgi:hypothetical protein
MPCQDYPVTVPNQQGELFCSDFIENFETLEKLAQKACDAEDLQYLNYADFQSFATTNITTAGDWVKLNTTTQVIVNFGSDLVHTNNRITNINGSGWIKVHGIASLRCGNDVEVHVAIFKNGIIWPCSEQSVVTIFRAGENKASALPFQCTVSVDNGDYIEVFVKNNDNTNNIVLSNVNVIAEKIRL